MILFGIVWFFITSSFHQLLLLAFYPVSLLSILSSKTVCDINFAAKRKTKVGIFLNLSTHIGCSRWFNLCIAKFFVQSQYKIALNNYNRQLSRLSEMLNLEYGQSSYTARHSWVTAARNHNIPISVISAGMGHSSERTTQIYLTTLENSTIDSANQIIIECM